MNVYALWLLVLAASVSQAAATGERFPAFNLAEAESGRLYDLSDYLRGKVAVVVFMQTTCSVCKQELTALKGLAGRNPALSVIAVSVDSGGGGKVARYKEGNGFPFLFLQDPTFEKPALFGFTFTPGLVLTGRDGMIAMLKSGFKKGDLEELEKKIDELAR